jgi:hypothetical protein
VTLVFAAHGKKASDTQLIRVVNACDDFVSGRCAVQEMDEAEQPVGHDRLITDAILNDDDYERRDPQHDAAMSKPPPISFPVQQHRRQQQQLLLQRREQTQWAQWAAAQARAGPNG